MKRGVAWVVAQFVLAAVYLTLPFHHRPSASALSIFGFILLGLGAILLLSGLASLGRSLTPLPVPPKNARLITTGAFRLVRHPVYSGLIFAAFGWSIASNDPPRLLLSAVLFLFFDAKAQFEEKVLASRFSEYISYTQRVKRFIPWIY